MIIGNFKYDRKADTYAGGINTLTTLRSGVYLKPAEKGGEKGPDYRVLMDMGAGVVELGAAWKRKSEKGQDFLSVVLDDPALSVSLNAAMFTDKDTAQLVWSRPSKKKAKAE
jgi:uncharacterized protein (DUF736 family)